MATTFSWHGIPEAQAALRQIDARVQQVSRQTIIESGAIVKRQVQANASGRPGPNVQGGNLRRSVRNKLTRGGPHLFEEQVSAGGDLIYPPVHERGAVIRPTRGLYLVFQVDGHWVQVRQVTIPPRPYFEPALRYFRDVAALALWRRNWARAISGGL